MSRAMIEAVGLHGDLADRLRGAELPPLTLDSTQGPVDLAELGRDLLVLFIYPHATGLADAPVPGWDSVPGARGCTAQSCAFRDVHHRFDDIGATLAGLSVQPADEQRTFAGRVGLRYRLISDPGRQLADALGLPTFTLSGRTFYKRLTLIATRGQVVKAFYPIVEPERNAAAVLEWLDSDFEGPGLVKSPPA
jgi:peroxiredoxin